MTYEERIEKYIELCEQGVSRKGISETMGIGMRTVTNYQKISGVKTAKVTRQPNLNKNYFSVIDTEKKAYILGFIFADGYLESNERTVTLNIHKKDIDILYKIKEELNCGNEIRKSSTESCVRLYLSSMDLVEDLKKIGMTTNKSLTIPFPKIEDKLCRHFIRGFFDGDGHVGKRQCALVIGSPLFYKGFSEQILKRFGKTLYKNEMGNYSRVQLNRRDHDIVKWIYNDSEIHLDRKYKEYLEHWSNYTERIRSRG